MFQILLMLTDSEVITGKCQIEALIDVLTKR